jgi:small nuclear ribonucleoprotein (snRNP)-like protein
MAPKRAARRGASSLSILLQALVGRNVVLELRNEATLSGVLSAADDYMNCLLERAVWQPVAGPARPHAILYVRGRNLRMVHMPSGLDAAAALDTHIADLKAQRVSAALELLNRGHGRLAKGAESAGGASLNQAAGNDSDTGS